MNGKQIAAGIFFFLIGSAIGMLLKGGFSLWAIFVPGFLGFTLGVKIFAEDEKKEKDAEQRMKEEADQKRRAALRQAKAAAAQTAQLASTPAAPQMQVITDNQVAKDLLTANDLFILLSVTDAWMNPGYSIPYIGNAGEGHLQMYVFHGYDKIKTFIDQAKIEVLDGVYLAGWLDPNSKTTSFDNTVVIANYLKINEVIVDGNQCCPIGLLLQNSSGSMFILPTAEEQQKIDGDNYTPKIHFNPIDIYNYSNPYVLSEEQTNELMNYWNSDQSKDTKEDADYFSKLSLHQLCVISTHVRLQFLEQAMENKDEQGINYINTKLEVLGRCIVDKLKQMPKLYTIEDKEHHLYRREDCMYILYTDRYKYQGHYNYRTIEWGDVSMLWVQSTMMNTGYPAIKNIVVTDGPTTQAVVDLGWRT